MAQGYRIDPIAGDIAKWIRDTAQVVNSFIRDLSETNNTITAGTTQTQAGAAQLKLGVNRVSTATANDGVRLPFSDGGEECVIRNDGGASIKVWPPSGASVDDGTADAADTNTLSDNSARTYRAIGSNWYTTGNS